MINPLKAGDIAPEFTLPDQDGEDISLSDFQGQRVLIYFYPKAMTPGCTVQACGLRDNMDEFKKLGVDVLGISTDKPEKLSRFVERDLLNFTLLSDEEHKVCELFGVWGEKASWVRPMTVFTASAFWSAPTAKSKKCLTTLKPATIRMLF